MDASSGHGGRHTGYGGGTTTRSSSASSSSNVAQTFMTLEQKIEAMEKDVKQRLKAVAATEREGAVLKEELAQCRELRQALLKRWYEARIEYDEVQLQLLEAQGRVDAASKGIKDAQRPRARLQSPPRPPSSGASGVAACSALEEELTRGHALVLGAEMPARVLARFNRSLEAEVASMRRRQEEKKTALQALFQASLRGEEEAKKMVRIHEEMVACRGAIVKQRAAKAAVQAEVEGKRRELEELKVKSAEMARRLQEEETAYMNLHAPSSCPGPLPLPLPSPASAPTASTPADTEMAGGYGYDLSLACGDA